ncbi:hypothetical protein Taro_038649 [Colocasia esculenta]|uniref:WRKY domain-containing protein n=1 Tax=Colocasia esculenta TaxID=4460 RepID=A0A843WDF4_COLES|nr:hypothetical protein [Colocasia esculenta]
MGDSPPTKTDLVSSQEARTDAQACKKRKVAQKTVVTVKIETSSAGKQKGEGPPSDSWSWRKYGQKPIKGSPYPRGYYKCSTSKGCSAKKQVERCRTDPSMLIITYTSEHNHPDPDHPNPSTTTTITLHSVPTSEEGAPTTDSTKEPTKVAAPACEEEDTAAGDGYLQSQSPPKCSEEDVPADLATTEADKIDHLLNTLSEEGTENSSVEPTKSTEDDIFDELEELPVSSSFTGWVRSSSFDDRVLPLPIPLLDY